MKEKQNKKQRVSMRIGTWREVSKQDKEKRRGFLVGRGLSLPYRKSKKNPGCSA